MKEIIKAIEKTIPGDIEPFVLVGSGFLRALIWNSDEGCQFTICHQNPDTGEIGYRFEPCEVENVVRLVGAVSHQFHEMGGSSKDCDFLRLAEQMSDCLGFGMSKSAQRNGRSDTH